MERYRTEFKRNSRLRFVFGLAVELGIDDPLVWYNAVGDKVVDAWMGFKLCELDLQKDGTSELVTPNKALEQLDGNSFNRRT